jgi:hypothetical protein
MLTIKNILKNNIISLLKSKIFLVFILALIIRSFFVTLNYPFVFHPDEPTIVNSTINLRYDPNPKHFDWPTFYYYFTYPFFYFYEKIYFLLNDLNVLSNQNINSISYYLISRFLTSIFGAATAVIVYFILKNMKVTPELSLVGACIMALIPFHVTRSALALSDIPMVFFAGISIYFLSKNLNNFIESNFIWACFFAGLSVSTKYNGYMIFLTLALFILFIKKFHFSDFVFYCKSAGASFLGFFIGTPYFIFDYKTFFISDSPKGALWQFENVGKVSLYEQFTNFFQSLFIGSYELMGYIPMIFSLCFIIYFLYKREFLSTNNFSKFKLILIIQFLFIFWSVAGVEMQRSHYLMLVYLFLPIFTILFWTYFENTKKYLNLTYLILVILSIVVLYKRIDPHPVAKLYYSLELKSDKKSYLIAYNNSDIEKLLDKLKISKTKFNPKSIKFKNEVTHVISSANLCEVDLNCKWKLLSQTSSRNDSEIIYLYERK